MSAKITGITQKDKDILFAVPGTAEKYGMSGDQVNQRRYTIKKNLQNHNMSIEKAKNLPVIKEEEAHKSGIKQPTAPKAKMAVVAVDEFDNLFKIEETPPPLPLTGDEQKERALIKIRQMAKDCPANGAIVVPSKYRAIAMKTLNSEKDFATAKWKVYPIKDNPAQVRIYKMNLPSK